MRKLTDVLLLFFVSMFVVMALTTCLHRAFAGGDLESTIEGIQELQPATSEADAETMAQAFVDAGEANSVDPLLLVAIAFRESSLNPSALGQLRERGLMQVHGVALQHRPDNCHEDLETINCQIRTGARWLAIVREQCPGSPWRWVCSYGNSRCCSEQEGGLSLGTRRARRFYVQIGGSEWR